MIMSNNALFASFAVLAVLVAGACGVAIISDDSDAASHVVNSGETCTLNPGDTWSMTGSGGYYEMGSSTLSSSYYSVSLGGDAGWINISMSESCPLGIYDFEVIEYDSESGEEYARHSVTINVVESSTEGDLSFTSPAAVDAISGSTVSYQATTNVSGTAFSKDGGNASWLTVTSAGKLTGTVPSVTSKTDYTFGIKATTPGGQTLTQTVTFTVFPVAKLTATSSNVSGTVGDPISTVTITSNLTGTFSVKSGELPAGVNYSKSGDKAIMITGTPTFVGSSAVVFSCISLEGPSQTATINLSFNISEADLQITSEPPTGIFKVGQSYSYTLAANQDVTWSLVGAPDWLAVSSGKIVGSVPATYTANSTEMFSVKATSAGGQNVTQSITISIEPTLEFTSKPTASCVVTPVYEYDENGNPVVKAASFLGFRMMTLDATAGDEDAIDYTAPDAVEAITGAKFTYNAVTNISGTTFSKVSGADWLTVTSAGVVSGTAPIVASVNDSQIVIKATSPRGQTINQTVTVTVFPVAKLTASALSTSVHQGSEMSAITVTSNVSVTWSTSGTLPAGVTFSNGVLSGTPAERGTFDITVFGAAIDGPAQTASVKVTVVVGEPVLEITSTAPADLFKVGQSYSYTPVANVTGIAWTISGDGITDWLAVAEGKVTGQVPSKYTDATTVTYTLKAVSPEKQEATQTVTIAVEPIIEWTSIPTAACVVQPVYDYADDGTYTPGVMRFSLFMDVSAEGESNENAAITETGTRTFRFTWTGENAERVTWDFGDGETAEGFSVLHTYKQNGTYTYKCTGINSLGSSEVSGEITVNVSDSFDWSIVLYIVIALLVIGAIVAVVKRSSRNSRGSKRVGGR